MRKFIKRIKRIIAWLPLLWYDEDWDYGFLLKIIRFKLDRMSKCIHENNIVEANNRIAKQIRYAILLIDRIDSDYYFNQEYKLFCEKYGTPKSKFIKQVNSNLYSMITEYPKTTTYDEHLKAEAAYTELIRKVDKIESNLYDRLFKHLRLYIRRWWD